MALFRAILSSKKRDLIVVYCLIYSFELISTFPIHFLLWIGLDGETSQLKYSIGVFTGGQLCILLWIINSFNIPSIGIHGKVFNVVCFQVFLCVSEFFNCPHRVKQGCVCSPLLFSMTDLKHAIDNFGGR